MIELRSVIKKMEEIENGPQFDGWDAWIELHEWLVKQKPPEADGLDDWEECEIEPPTTTR